MLYALRFHSRFDASHHVDIEGHDRPHGHTFEIEAGVYGDLMTESGGSRRVSRSEYIQEKLDAIAAELDLRDLNAMMIGSDPVPEVIAAWILERIPDADYVQVEMGWRRETGWAKRTKR